MFFCFVWTLNSTRSAKVQENRKNKRDMFYLWFSHWYDTSKYISVEGIKSTDICFVSLYNKINYNISYHHFKIFPGQPVKTPFEILKTIVSFKNPREFGIVQCFSTTYFLLLTFSCQVSQTNCKGGDKAKLKCVKEVQSSQMAKTRAPDLMKMKSINAVPAISQYNYHQGNTNNTKQKTVNPPTKVSGAKFQYPDRAFNDCLYLYLNAFSSINQ